MFPTTRRTLVREVAKAGEHSADALNTLIEGYWEPCHRYILQRFRRSPEDAQDLVQGFFTTLIERDILARYDPQRGPFRPYLRACLDQFVLKQLERSRSLKRGGNTTFQTAEADLNASTEDPEELFHREWRRRMFTLAIEDLCRLCRETGREVRYSIFAAYDLADEPRPQYDDLAARYGLPVTTVTNHLAWARRELRRLLNARLHKTE